MKIKQKPEEMHKINQVMKIIPTKFNSNTKTSKYVIKIKQKQKIPQEELKSDM